MRRIHADLLLVLAAAIWGIAFLFQKSAMDNVGPLLFVAARAAVASLALLPLALREGRILGRTWDAGLLGLAVPAGLVFFVGAVLQQVGIVTATVTNTGFLTALYVVFTPIAVWVLIGAAPAPLVWPAVGLSFAGTWLLGGGTLGGFSTGDALVAMSAVFWALHVAIMGLASRSGRPILFMAIQFLIVAPPALAAALVFEAVSLAALAAAWVEIAFVGLLSSALTFTLFVIALRHTPAVEAAIILSIDTVFAALAAYLVLGERLPWLGWLGAGLILAATLAVQIAPHVTARPAAGRAAPEG